MDERARETITKYLGDIHALESYGLQPISRQVDQLKEKGHPEAQRALQDFKRTVESHIPALEARLKALGGSPTRPVKDVASTLAGAVAGLYSAVRPAEAAKAIRDNYTFFSHTAIAYLMLHTTAKGLGDEETARLAERGYRDSARLAIEIDRIVPQLVVAELRQDGLPVRDVSEECRALVRDAWAQQASAAGFGA
jgi:ferritin-like metal-binding protein YciE